MWIFVQFTGQSAQNLKFPDSWVQEAEAAVHKAEAEEAKVAAKVKADAAKVKADADKLKGDDDNKSNRRLLDTLTTPATGQLATETVYSEQPFEVQASEATVTSSQPVGMFLYALDSAAAHVQYDAAFRAYATVEYVHRDRSTGAVLDSGEFGSCDASTYA